MHACMHAADRDTPHTLMHACVRIHVRKGAAACLPHQVLRPGGGDHHGMLHVVGPKHFGLAPRGDARSWVDPVRQLRVRVDVLADLLLCEADRAAARAVPPSERLCVCARAPDVQFGWEGGEEVTACRCRLFSKLRLDLFPPKTNEG